MENKLKLKFEYRSLKFEIEGREEIVKEQFEKVKSEGLGNIVDTVDRAESYFKLAEAKIAESKEERKHIQNTVELVEEDYPSLRSILLKGLPKTETDWILIYGFYSSDYGKNEFNREQIINLYSETKRLEDNKKANLSNNLKSLSKQELLNPLNNTEFSLTEKGLKKINEIISGKSTSIKKPKISKTSSTKVKKNKPKTPNSLKIITNLNLRPNDNIHLNDFYKSFELNSFSEKILCIVYYLKEKLSIDNVGLNHIFTSLKSINEKVPVAFKQAIIDTKVKKGWIEYENFENINFSIAGSNYIEHDVKKVENA